MPCTIGKSEIVKQSTEGMKGLKNKMSFSGNMVSPWLMRTQSLLGAENVALLQNKSVCVLGLGGVGGAAAEALCRAGIGHLILFDHDCVDITNLNRQLFATTHTLGQKKAEAAKQRLLSISPALSITVIDDFYTSENAHILFSKNLDFVVDAIDTVKSKIDLAVQCQKRQIPLISCMGTGNRLDPSQLTIGDIFETGGCGCPLARIMRQQLKKAGVEKLNTVFSTEQPAKAVVNGATPGRHSPASISFVPPVAGYLQASWVIRNLLGIV